MFCEGVIDFTKDKSDNGEDNRELRDNDWRVENIKIISDDPETCEPSNF